MGNILGANNKIEQNEEANKSVPPKRLVKMDKFMLYKQGGGSVRQRGGDWVEVTTTTTPLSSCHLFLNWQKLLLFLPVAWQPGWLFGCLADCRLQFDSHWQDILCTFLFYDPTGICRKENGRKWRKQRLTRPGSNGEYYLSLSLSLFYS